MTVHEYLLNRDAEETKRLNTQHSLWVNSLGYKIHPVVAAALPASPCIADIATGTGVWLLDAAQEYPSSGSFHGFDISTAQFPPSESLPSNVSLHKASIKEPFPEIFHGKFDLVHIRMIVLAMEKEDWLKSLLNVRTILKPGGWVQWEDFDASPMHRALRSRPESTTDYVQRGFDLMHSIWSNRVAFAARGLFEAFDQGGLRNVVKDTVSSDRVPETRALATQMEIGVVTGVCKQQINDGIPGALPLREVEALVEGMHADCASGAYINFYMNCAVGQEPE